MVSGRQSTVRRWSQVQRGVTSVVPAATFVGMLAAAGCSGDGPPPYVNALTGASCTPSEGTYVPWPGRRDGLVASAQYCAPSSARARKARSSSSTTRSSTTSSSTTTSTSGNPHDGTPSGGPGDNRDDEHSGKIDCIGDGDSGQGNDRDGCRPQDFPQPGCDDTACCDSTVVVIPAPPASEGGSGTSSEGTTDIGAGRIDG